jgi:hypothetical protein
MYVKKTIKFYFKKLATGTEIHTGNQAIYWAKEPKAYLHEGPISH